MATKVWVGTNSGNEGEINTDANWDTSGVPEAADDVIFEDSAQNVTGGGATWAAVALGSFTVRASYTGSFTTTVQMLCAVVDLGIHTGPGSPGGSPLIDIDLATTASTVRIFDSAAPSDATKGAVRIQALHATTAIYIMAPPAGRAGAVVQIEGETDQAGRVEIINQAGGKLFCGSGLVLAKLLKSGGDAHLDCAVTAEVVNNGGGLTITGSGAVALLEARAGTCKLESTGTITNLERDGAAVDFTGSLQGRTVTNLKLLQGGGSVKADLDIVTMTNITGEGVIKLG